MADRIVMLDGGVLRADCTVETFRDRLRHYVLKFKGTPPSTPGIPGLLESFRTDHELAFTVANAAAETESLLAALKPDSLEPVEMTLEDAFVSYAGERGKKTFFASAARRGSRSGSSRSCPNGAATAGPRRCTVPSRPV